MSAEPLYSDDASLLADGAPEAASAMLSSCDPDNELNQACCDGLENATTPSQLAQAWRVCSPGITSVPFTQNGDDCLDGSCGGSTSCKYLRKGCNFISGNFKCTGTDPSGKCTQGTCKKCF